jgi:hypothetical protein
MKLNAIKSEFPMFYKERFFGFKNTLASPYKRGSFTYNNKVYNTNSEHLNDLIRGFYVKDQFGNTRILNSYLSKLTIETDFNDYASKLFEFLLENETNCKSNGKEINSTNLNKRNNKIELVTEFEYENKLKTIFKNDHSLIDKFKPGIGKTIRSYLHFVGCIRYSELDFDKERILINSPDFVLKNRKGSVYEHAILLACLLINCYNKKNIELIKFKNEKVEKNNNSYPLNSKGNSIINTNPNNNTENQNNFSYDNRKYSNDSSFETSQFENTPKRKLKNYALLNERETLTENDIKLWGSGHKPNLIKSTIANKQEKKKERKNEEKIKQTDFNEEKNYYFTSKELKILQKSKKKKTLME